DRDFNHRLVRDRLFPLSVAQLLFLDDLRHPDAAGGSAHHSHLQGGLRPRHDQFLRWPDAAAHCLGHRHLPAPPVLPHRPRGARRGGTHRRRRSDALLLGRGAAAFEDQHRRALRDPVHLRLEPVSLAAPHHHRRVDVYGGDRHQAHDRHRRRAHGVEPRHGDRGARPSSSCARGPVHAEVVRQRPGGDRKIMAAVTFREVRKRYGELEVIHGVSTEVADGEFVVIVGPSGCGKSTLLRMVAGLEPITSGEIRIGARVVNDLEPKDRDIAMVFQNYALYPHMSVYENMSYGLRIKRLSSSEIEQRVQKAAAILELSPFLKRKPKELSGGQRERVAMGRAIVREPAVFLFDEPLSNLDAKLRVQMRAELQSLHRRLGTTSLYVTHDQVEAMTLARRMIVMNAGRAEQIGAPLEVYARPATTFVAGFIGSPPMNLIPEERDGRKRFFGVRPEHLEPCSESEAKLVLEVDLVEPLGADTLVYGHPSDNRNGARIAARMHSSLTVSAGRLPLRYDPANVHYFDAETGMRL